MIGRRSPNRNFMISVQLRTFPVGAVDTDSRLALVNASDLAGIGIHGCKARGQRYPMYIRQCCICGVSRIFQLSLAKLRNTVSPGDGDTSCRRRHGNFFCAGYCHILAIGTGSGDGNGSFLDTGDHTGISIHCCNRLITAGPFDIIRHRSAIGKRRRGQFNGLARIHRIIARNFKALSSSGNDDPYAVGYISTIFIGASNCNPDITRSDAGNVSALVHRGNTFIAAGPRDTRQLSAVRGYHIAQLKGSILFYGRPFCNHITLCISDLDTCSSRGSRNNFNLKGFSMCFAIPVIFVCMSNRYPARVNACNSCRTAISLYCSNAIIVAFPTITIGSIGRVQRNLPANLDLIFSGNGLGGGQVRCVKWRDFLAAAGGQGLQGQGTNQHHHHHQE